MDPFLTQHTAPIAALLGGIGSPRGRDRARLVLSLAERQHGVLSRRQLSALGISFSRIQRELDARLLGTLFPGVYSLGHRCLTQEGKWMAAILAGGPDAALSHRSAAALWGLIPPRERIEILRSSSPDRPGTKTDPPRREFSALLTIHRSRVMDHTEFTWHHGFRVTSVARTFLNVAGQLSYRGLESAFAEAERSGLVDMREMAEVAGRGRGWRGIRNLRKVIESWNPEVLSTESELEAIFLSLCRAFAIPIPQCNATVAGLRVDCLWPLHRLIVELDGYRYHRSPRSFEDDRRRTLHLEDAGYRVVRLTHRMVVGEPEATARLVKRRLLDAR